MERNDVTATLCICNRDDLRSGWRCFADDHSVHLLLVAVICAGRCVWRRRRRSQFAPLHWTVSFHGVTQPTSRRCWTASADNVVHRNDVRRVFALCIRSFITHASAALSILYNRSSDHFVVTDLCTVPRRQPADIIEHRSQQSSRDISHARRRYIS